RRPVQALPYFENLNGIQGQPRATRRQTHQSTRTNTCARASPVSVGIGDPGVRLDQGVRVVQDARSRAGRRGAWHQHGAAVGGGVKWYEAGESVYEVEVRDDACTALEAEEQVCMYVGKHSRQGLVHFNSYGSSALSGGTPEDWTARSCVLSGGSHASGPTLP